MLKLILTAIAVMVSFVVVAGGNPEFVQLPENYRTDYTQYQVQNRGNGKQLAVLYANDIAVASAANSELADGSTIIMEVYKATMDESGEPVVNEDGLFKKGKFAAIAVMEKRSEWPEAFDQSQRADDWGFAIYQTDGTPKQNDLPCASCHLPLQQQDYMFSHAHLVDFAQRIK